MLTFKSYVQESKQINDVISILQNLGLYDPIIQDNVIIVNLNSKKDAEYIQDLMPDNVDFDILEINPNQDDEDEEILDDFDTLYHLVIYLDNTTEEIEEYKRHIRISSKGERRIKIKCNPGFRYDHRTKTCKPMSAQEKIARRRGIRKAVRTKRANPALRIRSNRKRLKAMKKRKTFGL